MQEARNVFEEYYAIPYVTLMSENNIIALNDKINFFKNEIIWEWYNAYKNFVKNETAICNIETSEYQFIYDDTNELINKNIIESSKIHTGRVVAVYGHSQMNSKKRDTSRQKGYLASTSIAFKHFGESYDKGHFVSLKSGGPMEINLFPQLREINRGWSAAGKRYRQMEKFCALNSGTFMFLRPVYVDQTERPAFIEFGYFDQKFQLITELFDNLRIK